MGIAIDDVRRALERHVPAKYAGDDARAAVAAVLRESRLGPEILLIRRAAHERDPWSGHMALPGGRMQPSDSSLVDTALRETREEVGLQLDSSRDLLGELDAQPAMARGVRVGLTIAPYVFFAREPGELHIDAREVADALWVPVTPMLSGEAAATIDYTHDGHLLKLPGFRVGEHVVWGLTYKMLSSFFDVLRRG